MKWLERARLIDMDESHLEMVLNWRNQDHIRDVMFHDQVITIEEHRNWFHSLKKNDRTIVKLFSLDNHFLGTVNFTGIDREKGKCSWGFYIGQNDAPKGSGTVLGFLALTYIFEQMNFRKVCAEVISHNEKSIHFHRKLGFKGEGILKGNVLRNGEYLDTIHMALLNKQWREKKNSIETMIKGMIV